MKRVISLIFFMLLSGCTSFFSANMGTTNTRTDVIVNGKAIASMPVLTPVRILKTSGDFTTVEVKGYRLESYPQILVRDMKRGEIYIEFPDEDEELATKSFKIIKKYEDDFGEIWQEVKGKFNIKTSDIVKNVSSINKKAKKTYAQTCSMCHRLHNPKDFSVNQWPHQVESMMVAMPLELSIKELIVKYLQQNAADSN